MTRSVWNLEGTTARFDDGRLQAHVELLSPLDGFHGVSFAGRAADADDGALGVDLGKVADDDLSLPETYARVEDLVATYRQTEARPFRLQAYWRRVNVRGRTGGLDATAVELQVSINTSLLDTHPSVPVTSRMAGTNEAGGAGGRRYRTVRTAAGFLYFEAVHPSDERHAHDAPTSSGGAPAHVLFGDFLEKGVIVRARIRAAFLPADATAADCDALYDDFVNEPLPLTT